MGGKRQERGAGALRQLNSGRWRAQVRVDGVYYAAPNTFDNKQAARTWLNNQNKQLAAGTWTPPAKDHGEGRAARFADYAETWLAQRELKPRTVEAYRKLLDTFLLPAWGPTRIDAITVTKVKAWYAGLDDSIPTTRAHTYGLLRAILQTAYQDDLIAANPCRIRGAGQVKRTTKTTIPTAEQVHELAAHMPSGKYRSMVLIAAWCGLRFGELTELRATDVIWDGNQPVALHVRRAVVRVEGTYEVGTPKSEAGIRDVTIPPHIRPDLADYLTTLPKTGDALLFPGSRNGSHMAPSTLYKVWYPAREAVGLPELRWHDLRHFSGTLAARTGATLAEVMGRLGHSTTQAAMRYQHAAADRDEQIAAAMSNVIPMKRKGA